MKNSSNNTRSLINVLGIPIILSSIYYETLFPFLVLIVLCVSSLEYIKLINRLNADLTLFILLPFNLLILLNAYFLFFNVLDMLILFLIACFIYEILFHKTSGTQNVAFYLMGAILIGYCLMRRRHTTCEPITNYKKTVLKINYVAPMKKQICTNRNVIKKSEPIKLVNR